MENDVKEVTEALDQEQNAEYPFGETGPSRDQIEEFKNQWGNIYFTMLGNGLMYFVRQISRKEYRALTVQQREVARKLQEITDKDEQQAQAEENEMAQENYVASTFTVFPQLFRGRYGKRSCGSSTPPLLKQSSRLAGSPRRFSPNSLPKQPYVLAHS